MTYILGILEIFERGKCLCARVRRIEVGREREGWECDKWEEELGCGVDSLI